MIALFVCILFDLSVIELFICILFDLFVIALIVDCLQKRRQRMLQQPRHLPHSLYLAGQGFVMGVALGLSGVVVKPVKGQKANAYYMDLNMDSLSSCFQLDIK